jgi:hypothetical protein
MSTSRTVWIVGEIRTEFDDQRFHLRDCYVLDQVSNRGRERRVELDELPDNYGPCQICAPARRHVDRQSPKPRTGVQPGATVVLLNPSTGTVSEHRIGKPGERGHGALSSEGPLGRALIGRTAGDEVRYETPRGESRVVQIVELRD